jgi:tRNA threonylcarbamoyladenosine biosynthesis protein TsaB
MLIASIDLATPEGSVALLDAGRGVAKETAFTCRNDHSARVLPALHRLLKAMGRGVEDIEAFAVTTGPGSFTGLRVALGVVEGMTFGRKDVPIAGVGTLYAAALAVQGEGRFVCPLLNAGRGDVYAALYESIGGEIVERIAPHVAKPREWMAALAEFLSNGSAESEKIVFHGTGAPFVEEFSAPLRWKKARRRKMRLALPAARHAARLLERGEPLPPPRLAYLKPPDVWMPGPAGLKR